MNTHNPTCSADGPCTVRRTGSLSSKGHQRNYIPLVARVPALAKGAKRSGISCSAGKAQQTFANRFRFPASIHATLFSTPFSILHYSSRYRFRLPMNLCQKSLPSKVAKAILRQRDHSACHRPITSVFVCCGFFCSQFSGVTMSPSAPSQPGRWPSPLTAAVKDSFAYKTVSHRMPIILAKVIDHLSRYKYEIYDEKCRPDSSQNELSSPLTSVSSTSSTTAENCQSIRQRTEEELKSVLGALSKLRYEMQTNKSIMPFTLSVDSASNSSSKLPDYFADLVEWNNALNSSAAANLLDPNDAPRWFESPWLVVECYMYRRIAFELQQTKYLSDLDPFRWQKADQLRDAEDRVEKMLIYLNNTLEKVAEFETRFSDAEKVEFENLLRLSLWGNKGDLSFNAGREEATVRTIDPHELQTDMKKILIADESDLIWRYLETTSIMSTVRVDFICDNYGFELITDLILGEFLLASRIATQIVYHVKSIPWFVSDTTVPDFYRILDIINNHTGGFGDKFYGYLRTGKFVVKTDHFWTSPYSFDQMPSKAPELYSNLQKSNLIVIKGDLNYRKLTGDLYWNSTTQLMKAARDFRPAPYCALRGLKAEIAVGLKEGQENDLKKLDEDWMISGSFAVIQFVNPQKVELNI